MTNGPEEGSTMAVEKKLPAFQFYPRDWLASPSVMMMTLAEQGAYMRLLSFQWLNGSIPDNDDDRARILLCSESDARLLFRNLSKHFVVKDGLLVNERLREQYDEALAFRALQSEKGKRSAEARWGCNQTDNQNVTEVVTEDVTEPQPKALPKSNSASASASASSTTKNPPTPQGAFKGVEVPPELVPHLEALKEWEQYRKQRKVKTEAATWRKQFAFLKDQPDPEACINQSILQGWSGLFPVKSGMSPRDSMNDKRDRLLRGMV